MFSILEREMRVASRKKWTFRVRLWTNVIAFLFAAPMVVFTGGGSFVGSGVFKSLVFVSFWFCILQGVRTASSSIADEKRNGTLGLLFLTDLSTMDIVMGKLFGVLLPMIQPLLAFLPMLAITILLGGITGGEILRAGLVLGSALLFSVSIGLLVSASSRKSEETGNKTMLLLVAWLFLPLLGKGKLYALNYLSVWTAYDTIPDPGYRRAGEDFLYSLLTVNVLSFLALRAAAYFLPRRWEQHQEVLAAPKKKRFLKMRFSPAERARLLTRNPGEWLAMRHSMFRAEAWLINGAVIGLGLLGLLLQQWTGDGGYAPLYIGWLILMLRMASQASYPLAEARRSGEVEMIMSTPLNPWLLIRGQITALHRQFLAPVGTLVVAAWLVSFLDNSSGIGPYVGGLIFTLTVVGGAYLTGAVGMWMGLRQKSPNSAFFMTLVYILGPGFFLACLWFFVPIYWLILFLVAVDKISGRNYRRLLLNEKELTPQTPPPVIAARRRAA